MLGFLQYPNSKLKDPYHGLGGKKAFWLENPHSYGMELNPDHNQTWDNHNIILSFSIGINDTKRLSTVNFVELCSNCDLKVLEILLRKQLKHQLYSLNCTREERERKGRAIMSVSWESSTPCKGIPQMTSSVTWETTGLSGICLNYFFVFSWKGLRLSKTRSELRP